MMITNINDAPKFGEEIYDVYALLLSEVHEVTFFLEDILIHISLNLSKGWRVETWREGYYLNTKGRQERSMILLTSNVVTGDEYNAINFVLNME
jgi:hypothetical protein